MSEEMVIHRDWSQLPVEILEIIAENVVSISDFIRFRSVCTWWRKAAVPSKLRPQPPILHLPYNILNPDRYFFSLSTKQTYHISMPQLVGKRILTTANGWMLLLVVETKALSLHNPVSLASIHLPATNNSEQIQGGHVYYDHFSDDFVILIYDVETDTRPLFCKVGDESWSVLEIDFDSFTDRIIYHKGKFFAKVKRSFYILDASTAASSGQSLPVSWAGDIPRSKIDSFFVTCNGELFLVFKSGCRSYSLNKVEFDGEKMKWSKVRFEDYAIFLMAARPIWCCVKDFAEFIGPILCWVKDFHEFKGHCAYGPKSMLCVDFGTQRTEEVCIIDCKNGTRDYVSCRWSRPADFGEEFLWITLSLQ